MKTLNGLGILKKGDFVLRYVSEPAFIYYYQISRSGSVRLRTVEYFTKKETAIGLQNLKKVSEAVVLIK